MSKVSCANHFDCQLSRNIHFSCWMKSIGCQLCATREPTFASVPIDTGKAKRAKISQKNSTNLGGLAVLSHAAEEAAMSFVEGLSHDTIQAQGVAPTIIAAESVVGKSIALDVCEHRTSIKCGDWVVFQSPVRLRCKYIIYTHYI
jgi:hypothetical protein